jgi:eukaryotic-like serine/threonine-protein kinase
MSLRERIRTLFSLFLLFTVLVAVARISAITAIRMALRSNQVTMPSLTGVSEERAERVAAGLGLEVKVEDRVYSDKYVAGQIVSQVPAKGTQLKVGQHVHVLVSLGPPTTVVPDLTGSSVRAAQINATQRGLAVGDVVAIHWPGIAPDQTVAQDPPASTAQVRRPAVNLLVSLGDPTPAYVCPRFIGMRLAQARSVITTSGFNVGEVTPVPGAPGPAGVILAQTPAPGSKIGPGASFEFQVAEQAGGDASSVVP